MHENENENEKDDNDINENNDVVIRIWPKSKQEKPKYVGHTSLETFVGPSMKKEDDEAGIYVSFWPGKKCYKANDEEEEKKLKAICCEEEDHFHTLQQDLRLYQHADYESSEVEKIKLTSLNPTAMHHAFEQYYKNPPKWSIDGSTFLWIIYDTSNCAQMVLDCLSQGGIQKYRRLKKDISRGLILSAYAVLPLSLILHFFAYSLIDSKVDFMMKVTEKIAQIDWSKLPNDEKKVAFVVKQIDKDGKETLMMSINERDCNRVFQAFSNLYGVIAEPVLPEILSIRTLLESSVLFSGYFWFFLPPALKSTLSTLNNQTFSRTHRNIIFHGIDLSISVLVHAFENIAPVFLLGSMENIFKQISQNTAQDGIKKNLIISIQHILSGINQLLANFLKNQLKPIRSFKFLTHGQYYMLIGLLDFILYGFVKYRKLSPINPVLIKAVSLFIYWKFLLRLEKFPSAVLVFSDFLINHILLHLTNPLVPNALSLSSFFVSPEDIKKLAKHIQAIEVSRQDVGTIEPPSLKSHTQNSLFVSCFSVINVSVLMALPLMVMQKSIYPTWQKTLLQSGKMGLYCGILNGFSYFLSRPNLYQTLKQVIPSQNPSGQQAAKNPSSQPEQKSSLLIQGITEVGIQILPLLVSAAFLRVIKGETDVKEKVLFNIVLPLLNAFTFSTAKFLLEDEGLQRFTSKLFYRVTSSAAQSNQSERSNENSNNSSWTNSFSTFYRSLRGSKMNGNSDSRVSNCLIL